jgi:stringent starvation protein B
MSQTQPLPPKKEVALALLERSSVFVHLDPRQTTVVVPPGFKKQPQLVLQVGLNMSVRIPDLRVDEEGMSCTLSFNRTPFFCVVPWSSVFAMMDDEGQGMVWPDDVPAEVARQAQVRAADGPAAPEAAKAGPGDDPKRDAPRPKRSRKRPPLAAVPGRVAGGAAERVTEQEEPAREPAFAPGPSAPAEQAAVVRPVAAPAPAGLRTVEGAARRKRELPPYLRVVK